MIDYAKAATAHTQLEDATRQKLDRDTRWQLAIIEAREAGLSYSTIAATANRSESYCRKIYEDWVKSQAR